MILNLFKLQPIGKVLFKKIQCGVFPKNGILKRAMRLLHKSYGGSKSQAKKLQKWVVENFEESIQYQKFCDVIYKPTKEEEEWNSLLNEVQMI